MPKGILRRTELELTLAEAGEILAKGDLGFLGTVGEDGTPYTIPVNYAAAGDRIYFHSAGMGHKLDNIGTNRQVCFTVVGEYQVLPAKLSAYYRSVVAFGTAAVLTDPAARRHGLRLLMEKYSPGYQCTSLEQGTLGRETAVVEISIETLTGKRSHDQPDGKTG